MGDQKCKRPTFVFVISQLQSIWSLDSYPLPHIITYKLWKVVTRISKIGWTGAEILQKQNLAFFIFALPPFIIRKTLSTLQNLENLEIPWKLRNSFKNHKNLEKLETLINLEINLEDLGKPLNTLKNHMCKPMCEHIFKCVCKHKRNYVCKYVC